MPRTAALGNQVLHRRLARLHSATIDFFQRDAVFLAAPPQFICRICRIAVRWVGQVMAPAALAALHLAAHRLKAERFQEHGADTVVIGVADDVCDAVWMQLQRQCQSTPVRIAAWRVPRALHD